MLFCLACAGVTMLAADWPHWRGPGASGVAGAQTLPVRWSATENVAWKAPLAGVGCLDADRQRRSRLRDVADRGGRQARGQPSAAGPGRRRGAQGERALDTTPRGAPTRARRSSSSSRSRRADGKRLWERRIEAEGALTPVHDKHNLATPSPVTDGSLVYAWFGTGQIVALESRRHDRLAASPRPGDRPLRHPVGTRQLAGALRRSADPALRPRAASRTSSRSTSRPARSDGRPIAARDARPTARRSSSKARSAPS